MIRVGVDVGGTFTDIVLERDGTGSSRSSSPRCRARRTTSRKAFSTASSRSATWPAWRPATIDAVFHGTTVATNMVIERAGAEVGMITTRGFRDILHMARHKRPHNFSLQFDRALAIEAAGEASQPHRGERAHHAARRRGRGAARRRRGQARGRAASPSAAWTRSIVAFLFSFLNNEHEQRAKEIVAVDPARRVRDLLVRCRQHHPRIRALLQRGDERLYRAEDLGLSPEPARAACVPTASRAMVRIMQSNGGISTIENCERAADRPAAVGSGRRRDRRPLDRRELRQAATSSPSTSAAPRPTSA